MVMPREPYKKTFLDELASLTIANVPRPFEAVIEIGDALLLAFGILYLGRLIKRKLRAKRGTENPI